MTFKKTAGEFIFNVAKKAFGGGKQKTTGTEVIKNVPIAKNIDTKKAIEQKVVKTVDKAFKDAGAPPSIANQQAKSKLKKEEGKKLKDFSYKLDKIEDKIDKRNKASKKFFNKGGRVGLKFGSKKKSNVKKIKETFGPKKGLGMQSVIYGLDKNPKITAADPKAKFIAAAKKKTKKKVI